MPNPLPAPVLLAVALSGILVPAGVTLFWMIADDIGPARAFATPFPYLFFAVMWVLVIPVYLGGRSWFGTSLPRLAAGGLLLAALPTLIAWSTFLPRHAFFATALLAGAGLVGAFGFWLCLRLFTPRTRSGM